VILDIQPHDRPGEFALVGELDMSTAPLLLAALKAPASEGDLRLCIERLHFCDSSGVQALIALAATGQRVTLVCPRANVARVFDIMGMHKVPGIEIRSR
jgi:anti-anti-sigma factor